MRPLLSMRWRDLLFAHWSVAPATIAAKLPDEVSVDTYEGDAYLGVVPFVMDDIRVRGAPLGLGFGELNLRTYVTVDGTPGVYFFNLDADDRLGVILARKLFRLPYYRAEMDIETTGSDADREVSFRSRRRTTGVSSARFDGRYGPDGDFATPEADSRAEFLTERYRFYTTDDGGRVYYGDIDHEPWSLAEGWADIEENTLFDANGFDRPGGEPILHFAAPIDVTAGRIRRR
ncbi:YqjF family protein [Natronomonas amylolytica]|uniref:YqjF family protein n=1 Tax=Natronomonas amylolytica TaxID=3108498 RepID=UPI003009D021